MRKSTTAPQSLQSARVRSRNDSAGRNHPDREGCRVASPALSRNPQICNGLLHTKLHTTVCRSSLTSNSCFQCYGTYDEGRQEVPLYLRRHAAAELISSAGSLRMERYTCCREN